jgi:nitrous oxidase accessory protein NosD
MRSGLIVLSAVLVSCCWVTGAMADVHNVYPGGSIQTAIEAADPGDVIDVAAGFYEEQIEITENITLDGAGVGATTIQSPAALTKYFTTPGANNNFAVIYVHDATGVVIRDVTVDGLGRGSTNYRFQGIGFWNAGGSVSHAEVLNIRDNPLSGAQHGVGVYANHDSGGPYAVTLLDVLVEGFQKNGLALSGDGLAADLDQVIVNGAGATDVTAQNGIQVSYGADATLTDCAVDGIGYSGSGWVASGMLFVGAGTVDIGGISEVTDSQVSIIYQETNGTVAGVSVSAGDIVSAEGISIRDYGYVLKSGGKLPAPVSPFLDEGRSTRGSATVVTIDGASFTGVHHAGSYGIAAWALGDDVSVTVTDSEIVDWEIGVVAYESGSAVTADLSSSAIRSNDAGFWTNAALTQPAEANWWGDASGPKNATTNPGGLGDEVYDGVDYGPWYAAIPGTSPMTWGTNASIQEAVEAASPNDVIHVAPGLYTERVVVDRPLTLLGATAGINKNGYTVPALYAWNTAVESVINYPDPTGQPADQVGVDIRSDNVTFKGFVVQILNARVSSDHVLRLDAQIAGGAGTYLSNVIVENNVLGPATNVLLQNGTYGRMGLYFSSPTYPSQRQGIRDSHVAGNKIIDTRGNGDNVFIWGAAESYGSLQNADYTGTVIEDNEICGSRRSGIEIAGGVSNLTIRSNKIYNNSSTNGGPSDANLKYGNGLVVIRMGGDKTSPTALGCAGLAVQGNDIYGNEKNGIYLGPISSGHTISDNVIRDNGWDGVRVDLTEQYYGGYPVYNRTSNITLAECSLTGNSLKAVRVIDTPTNGFVLDASGDWFGTTSASGVAAKVSA